MRRGIPVSDPEPEPMSVPDLLMAGFLLGIVLIVIYVVGYAVINTLTEHAV